jgi:hypothetical protein
VMQRLGVGWAEWRDHLATAIAAHPFDPGESTATAYYTAWVEALESLLEAHSAV